MDSNQANNKFCGQRWSNACESLELEFVGSLDQLTGDVTIPCSLELDRPGHFAVIMRERNKHLAVHKTFRLFDERTGSLGGDLGEKRTRGQGCMFNEFNVCLSLEITFCEEN